MTEGLEIREGRLMACYLREEVVCVPEGVCVIEARAFKGCTSIKKILLPASLERIEEQAFKGCRQLEFVSFPEKLNYIGAYAFHRCHNLKEIWLPKSVTELSDCAFLYCDGLELASLPGVCKIGKQAFVNATSLKKLVVSSNLLPKYINDSFTGCTRIEEISIVDFDSEEEKAYSTKNLIAVIEAAEEMPELIRAIAADIYHMMDIVQGILIEFHVEPKEVVVPEGIREIGKSCFFNKRGILEISLPNSLERIGERAFRNCINLEHILLKNGDTKIDKDAFKNCTTLKRVTLNGVTYSLTGLPYQADNRQVPELVHTIHMQILGNFCISGTVLLRYWGNEARVTVPDGTTVIGERAFAGNEAVGKLILPESVKEIQKEAFADCVVLQTLNFPKGLKQIGEAAFEGCVKLLRAEIPAEITELPSSVFSRCKKLGQVIWADKIKLHKIGQQAFYGCQGLKEIVFPETLEQIGTLAFYQCHALRRIVLPEAVWQIEAEAFACCAGLFEVMIKGNLTKWGRNIFAYNKKLKKIVFSEKQEVIPEYLAWNCEKLQQVTVQDSLKMVGLAAFEGTAFWKELPIPKRLGTVLLDGREWSGEAVIPEGVTAIAGGAFYGNSQITSIVLPDTLEQIGERAFCHCTALKEIRLPKKVTVISAGAFAYSTQLKRIAAEGNIEEVGEKACYQCCALEEVPDLYDTKIGDYAFSGCRKWKKGTVIHAKIGAFAFEETGFIKMQTETGFHWTFGREKVWYCASLIIGDTIADGRKAKGEVCFSVEAGSLYAVAPYAYYGNHRITRVILPEGLKEIGAFAFCGCTQLCEVVIPDSVERIGESAFEKCSQLLIFSSAASVIGNRAFALCEKLRFVWLPRISVISKESFFHCSSLETLEIMQLKRMEQGCLKECIQLKSFALDSVKEIGEETFAGCEGLCSASFSADVQIGAKAFLDCCGLTNLYFSDSSAQFDHSAFWGCTFLERIQTDNRMEWISGYEDLFQENLSEFSKRVYASAIGCFSFQENQTIAEYRTNARAIRIPNGICTILGEVFKDCIRLERVEIPDSVTYIGERAFWGTKWLDQKKAENPLVICNRILLDGSLAIGHIVIPKEVLMISGWAFSNGYGILELTLCNPKLVIEPHTFRNCIYLERVTDADGKVYCVNGISIREEETLPSGIRQIFEDAFNCYKTDENGVLIECTGNITNFALVRGITAIGNFVFQESNLLTHAKLTPDVTWIGESAFARCKWLASIEQAEGVKEIGAKAFSDCIRLERTEFADSLQKIGKQAFENCTLLREIVLPEGIKEIPRRAFFRCRSLQKLVLPQSLERIEEEAFAFCSSLSEMVLPDGIKWIEKRAFAWCEKLEGLEIPFETEVAEDAFVFSGV